MELNLEKLIKIQLANYKLLKRIKFDKLKIG